MKNTTGPEATNTTLFNNLAPIDGEFARLESLRSFSIIDTDPEIEYDRITQLASNIAGTKVAVISFVEEHRQWFKSKIGFDATETAREASFCHYAIQSDKIFIVPDATADSRFKDNPYVVGEPNLRFYAGAQIKTKEGHRLGTLCVFDSKVGNLTQDQQDALENLANQVMSLMELKNYQRQVENYQNLLTESAKLSVLGEMAAGLAHEINNPLTVVMVQASELLNRLKKDPLTNPEYPNAVEMILKAAQRISNITKGVKAYSVNAPIENMEDYPLHKMLYETVNMFTETKSQDGVTFLCDFRNAENIKINCHPSMLGQVILNLLNNAHEAVVDDEKKWIKVVVELDQQEQKVLVQVIDSGKGIPNEIAPKMMEPFFTTKSKKLGTGLGLSVSNKIVKVHNGKLFYDSSLANTTFTVELPYRKN